LHIEERVLTDHQNVCPQLGQLRKGRIEIALAAGVHDMGLQTELDGCRLQVS
jgi:hypothetical protein